ncbi:MAG: hypothetical protein J6U64_04785, partial [Alphaproteobacteria bacterium]|nr:hypothetical protein [Alphaproteobacteria bacterium]
FTRTTFLEMNLPETEENDISSTENVATEETVNVSEAPLSEEEDSADSVLPENEVIVTESISVNEEVSEEVQNEDISLQEDIGLSESEQVSVIPTPQETLVSEPTPANLDETLSQIAEFLPEMPSIPVEEDVPTEEQKSENFENIPELEQFEEMLQQKDYSRFAPKEEEIPLGENSSAEQPVQEEQSAEPIHTPSPFEQQDPEMPVSFIDPERQEPLAVAQEFPVLEIQSDDKTEEIQEERPLIEEPLMPIRKKGGIFWGLIGYLLFLFVFGGLVLWLGEPLLKRFFPAITPFYDRAYEIYDDISKKVASMNGIEYVHAVYKKIDIRTKAVGEGLDFRNVRTNAVYENNVLTLNISGSIVNTTDDEKMLPFLYFVVYDKSGNELQNLTNVPKKESLKGRETLAFKGKISPLHPGTVRADITFRKE